METAGQTTLVDAAHLATTRTLVTNAMNRLAVFCPGISS